MDEREIKSVIEGLLFTWGDPLSINDISNILDINKKEVEVILKDMIDEFNYERRGIQILKINSTYQLGTRPEHYEWIKKLSVPKESKSLSSAALETLAIIAYKQPIIKNELETIRGVKCDKAIATLLEKKLVKEDGRLDKTGRPILYATTDEFLKGFGLNTISDLPEISELTKENEDENNK